MVHVTKHAISRLMERGNVSENKAMAILVNKTQPRRHEIIKQVDLLGTARIELTDELLAIVAKKNNRYKIVTVRKRKWK